MGAPDTFDVDAFVGLCKKWRAVGSKLSILRCRTLYVQFADDDRTSVPFFLRDAEPSAETAAAEEAAMVEEEEDDDVMEAKLLAAQEAKKASNLASEATAAAQERDALNDLEDMAAQNSSSEIGRAHV